MYYYKFKFIYNEGYAVDAPVNLDEAKLYEEFSYFENDVHARKRYRELFKEIPDRIISSHWRDAQNHEGYKIDIEALHKGYNTYFKTGKIHYCIYSAGGAYKSAYCTNRKFQHVFIVDNSHIVNCKSCLDKLKRADFYYKVIWKHNEIFYHGTVSINVYDIYDIHVKLFHENTIDKTNIKQNIIDSEKYISLKEFLEKTMNTKLEKDYKIWLLRDDWVTKG